MVLEACITRCIIILREMRGAHQGDRGDRTEGGEEGKGDGGERGGEGGEEILAHGWAGQQKVVQEVLAD